MRRGNQEAGGGFPFDWTQTNETNQPADEGQSFSDIVRSQAIANLRQRNQAAASINHLMDQQPPFHNQSVVHQEPADERIDVLGSLSSPLLSSSHAPFAVSRLPQNNDTRDELLRPNEFDILCGRGRRIQEHTGNVLLHRLVDLHIVRYSRAPRDHRRRISLQLVKALQASGSRFLKRSKNPRSGEQKAEVSADKDDDEEDEGGGAGSKPWIEVKDSVAIEKVAHCFRSRRQRAGAAPTPQRNLSGVPPGFR